MAINLRKRVPAAEAVGDLALPCLRMTGRKVVGLGPQVRPKLPPPEPVCVN